jgi:3-oxoacyl-[acyl-carrier-protein] synthase-3
MSRSVYITKLAKFLPNDPVSNDEIEGVLGMINGKPSKARSIVLRSNQIKTRYYAIDKNGNTTHNSAQLTKEAILNLCDKNFTLNDIQLLACGSSSPDQILPSHTSMVHGELGSVPMEIVATSGACSNIVQALKYSFMSVQAGHTENAVCAGSERMSHWMKAKYFQEETEKIKLLETNPMLAFEKDFLRFMLSDGAGAALLEAAPNKNGLSLKIEWIEQRSYAHELPTCMYAGAVRNEAGGITGWASIDQSKWTADSVFAIKQDTRLLGDNIVKYGGVFLKDIVKKRDFDVSSVNYFLPHLSSYYFAPKIENELREIGLEIPASKWFTNLDKVGNIGVAAPFVMLEEFVNSGKLKVGDTILMMIPESARFNFAYILYTVV